MGRPSNRGIAKGQSLLQIVYKSGRVIVSEPIWIGHRIRNTAQLPDHRIVLLTDDAYLILVSVDEDTLRDERRDVGYNFEPKLARCLVCHQFEPSTPSLQRGPVARACHVAKDRG
jgi:hypothetical protein